MRTQSCTMYAKIAGTDYEDVGKFVAMAISQMEKVHGKPKEKVDTVKTGDGQPYFINEYRPRNRIPSGNASLTSNSKAITNSIETGLTKEGSRISGKARSYLTMSF